MTSSSRAAADRIAVGRTALTNVRVFDGRELSQPRTVVIDGGVIGTDDSGAQVLDVAGAVLLPGLIDAHIHLHGRDTLEQLCSYGVTTGLDMGTWPPELLASLRGVPGLTDIRSAGLPAIGVDGPHAMIPGGPAEGIVRDPQQARPFVAARVAEGADYLKIVAEAPGQGGPDQASLDALVAAAHEHGKRVVVHAVTAAAFTMAVDAGADMVTHAPLDRPVDEADVTRMATQGMIAIPTLTMMEGMAAARGAAAAYAVAARSVTALHQAGVPILVGTDANAAPFAPFQVPHGEGLHHELELLVDVGLSMAEVLRAATSLPAFHFGLHDRGAIEPGLRADLVLIEGDPLADIRATRNIRRIWCGGTEHSPA